MTWNDSYVQLGSTKNAEVNRVRQRHEYKTHSGEFSNQYWLQATALSHVSHVSCSPPHCQHLSLGEMWWVLPIIWIIPTEILKLFMTVVKEHHDSIDRRVTPALIAKLYLGSNITSLTSPVIICKIAQLCFSLHKQEISLNFSWRTDGLSTNKRLRSAGQEQNKINKNRQRRVWDWNKITPAHTASTYLKLYQKTEQI